MVNVKYRTMAELIKSFLDTAINPNFKRNIYHQALYNWHVEGVRTIPDPGKPPYYSTEFFDAIRDIKDEGLLRLSGMTLGMWYKALLENHVTQEVDDNGFSFSVRSKAERQNSDINWERVWALSILPGLDSNDTSFTFCLLHNLLATQECQHRVLSHKVTSSHGTVISQDVPCDRLHALVHCPFNNGVGLCLLQCMRKIVPHLQPDQLMFFNFNLDSQDKDALPAAWPTPKVLRAIWLARTQKKATNIQTTRAAQKNKIHNQCTNLGKFD